MIGIPPILSKKTTVVAFGIASILAGVVFSAFFVSGKSSAAPSVEITSLDAMQVNPATRTTITRVAREASVDPANVVSVAPAGAGSTERASLVGKNAAGTSEMAFFNGFGMTSFSSIQKLLAPSPMYVNVSLAGPATETREVGLVGVATDAVTRVVVSKGDGSESTVVPVARDGYEFFAYLADSPSSFPVAVRSYDAGDNLVAEQAVDARPLCATSADCLK